MSKAKIFLLLLLALLALLPNLISSIFWGPIDIGVAVIVVGVMLFLAIRFQRVAKWAIVPLAAILTLPPYGYWIIMDNDGTYRFIFNEDGVRDSFWFFAVIFVVYAVIFFLMYLVARRKPTV